MRVQAGVFIRELLRQLEALVGDRLLHRAAVMPHSRVKIHATPALYGVYGCSFLTFHAASQ